MQSITYGSLEENDWSVSVVGDVIAWLVAFMENFR